MATQHIVITGAAGFIGSALAGTLNRLGKSNLILVDDFSAAAKFANLEGKVYSMKVERSEFPDWFDAHAQEVEFVYHIGARTDTTEFDKRIFDDLNVSYSKRLWEICARNCVPFVYASSAATYGLGEYGYSDNEEDIPKLQPLNPYGWSKQEFDIWALQQKEKPPYWVGLKFFNVYGPNEYHKGRMASVIFHAYHQIRSAGEMKLFRSHNPDYSDGGQMRDFIYVKDLINVCIFLYEHRVQSGIYNLGSGKARTFLDLAKAVFAALGRPERITFIDTPIDIRDKYQYFTEADMSKLIAQGYSEKFTSLEEGVTDYVQHYLMKDRFL